MEPASSSSTMKKKRPLAALAKFFHKSSHQKKTSKSETDLRQHNQQHQPPNVPSSRDHQSTSGSPSYDGWHRNDFKLGSSNRLDMTSPSEANFDEAALEAELEALHMSRVDNPYIQLLSSQDNLDGGPRSPRSPSLQSPPSDQQSSIFSPTLSEVHSHLIRSPPPINWPIHNRRYYPVSPRSTGTFSPDSSDGLELDNTSHLDSQANRLKASVAPSRGYSPYNCCNTTYSRSHSEEHILSPCRDLLHKSEALFSPIRGANTEKITQNALSPRSGSCYDYQNRRQVGRTASFASTARSTGSSRITLNQMPPAMTGSRRSFYYTMSYDDEADLDDGSVLSPNRNQLSSEYGAISPTASSAPYGHRRSLAGLTGRLPLSAFTGRSGSSGWSCSLHRRRNLSKPETPGSTTSQRTFFFTSWRRSYSASKGSKRMTSPVSSRGPKKRLTDVKSMENLLSSSGHGGLDDEDNTPSTYLTRKTLPFDC